MEKAAYDYVSEKEQTEKGDVLSLFYFAMELIWFAQTFRLFWAFVI